MTLTGEEKKKYQREYMKKKRSNIGSNKTDTTGRGLTVSQDMLDKLTDPVWRGKSEKICHAFQASHHPSYMQDVWLGDYNLSQVCELLEVTG